MSLFRDAASLDRESAAPIMLVAIRPNYTSPASEQSHAATFCCRFLEKLCRFTLRFCLSDSDEMSKKIRRRNDNCMRCLCKWNVPTAWKVNREQFWASLEYKSCSNSGVALTSPRAVKQFDLRHRAFYNSPCVLCMWANCAPVGKSPGIWQRYAVKNAGGCQRALLAIRRKLLV